MAGFLLFLMSCPITSLLLLYPLEKWAGEYADPSELRRIGVRFVVVLGGGASEEALTPADKVGWSLLRLMEGIRLWKRIPESKLALSGMGFPAKASNPSLMYELPQELGVPRDALVIEARAWDTEGEAYCFAGLVGKAPFALVTSAYHIPRAMACFKGIGLTPIAAPCEFMSKTTPPTYSWFLPDAGALFRSQLAIHEYLGLVWFHIRPVMSRE